MTQVASCVRVTTQPRLLLDAARTVQKAHPQHWLPYRNVVLSMQLVAPTGEPAWWAG